MPELLRTTLDKFTFLVAADRLYAADGAWLQAGEAGRVRLGVTDYFQQHNGDVAFATVRPAGTLVRAGQPFAEIETMKVTLEVASPISGRILRANPALEATPELINQDPYGEAWLAEFEATDWPADRRQLLDAASYLAVMKKQAEQELGS